METLGFIAMMGMLSCIGWVLIQAEREVAYNKRKERQEEIAIKCAIQREIDKANDVAEGLYKPY